MKAPSLIWFRNDLRTHDHAALFKCGSIHQPVLGVYCFDEAFFGKTPLLGAPRMSDFRKRFVLESVVELRNKMRQFGSELVLRVGNAEQIIPEIARQIHAGELHFGSVAGVHEVSVARRVQDEAERLGIEVHQELTSTLVSQDDLPCSVSALPNTFSQFRRLVEDGVNLRRPVPEPTELVPPSVIPESDPLPTLDAIKDDPRAVLKFKGGEKAATSRLKNYFWDKDRLKQYKETRNGLVGESYSTKLSPWLALGCISARSVMREILWYEEERVKNGSTYWLFLELLWRDFFEYSALKFGPKLFALNGTRGIEREWSENADHFHAWTKGQTGFPLIDASMLELSTTGFLSNRGRQWVSNFLTKELGIDWRWGAEWFESQLIDHDAAVNYGNWQYQAGVGSDPRENRRFNLSAQAEMYDPKAEFVKRWIPQLAQLPAALAHEPYKLGTGSPYAEPVIGLQWPHKTSA